jgi:hypothetical protein
VLVTAGFLLALPAAALAADTYADATHPNDSADCLTPATACMTIAGAISKAGAGDTIHVALGTYPEAITLGASKSLVATGSAASTIVSPSSGAAITVASGDPAGTIHGLTLRSGNIMAVNLNAAATLTGNTFDANPSNNFQYRVQVGQTGGSPVISGNTFTDPSSSGFQFGVKTISTGNPVISGNTFSGLAGAVSANAPFMVQPGTPVIRDNHISGTHINSGSASAINVVDSAATINGNLIDAAGLGQQKGVAILDSVSPCSCDVAMARNRILGQYEGVEVLNTLDPVQMDGDIVAGSTTDGLLSATTGGGAGAGDVSATNLTFSGNGIDVQLQNNHLTLDSSILEDPVGETGPMPYTDTCTISFSRGPTMTSGGNGCQDFQTTANPMFVNAAGNDYHLLAASPLIDQGDPAPPSIGDTDFDGDPRAIDSHNVCPLSPRRDIGADEVKPGPIVDCTPPAPPPPPPGTPATASPSTSTGLRAAALKKCKHKHGRARSKCKKHANLLPV